MVPGIPDTNYCFDGVEGWVELKYGERPARDSTAVFKSRHNLTAEQVEWILARRRSGGRVSILAQIDDHLFLVEARHALSFNSWTFFDFELQSFWQHRGPMREKDWWQLKDALTLLAS